MHAIHVTSTPIKIVLVSVVTRLSKPDHLSPSRKVRDGLADVISTHDMLTNQILLFHFETVATPWLQYVHVRLILVQF